VRKAQVTPRRRAASSTSSRRWSSITSRWAFSREYPATTATRCSVQQRVPRMSSRLFQEVREKRHYAVYSYQLGLSDAGAVKMYVDPRPQRQRGGEHHADQLDRAYVKSPSPRGNSTAPRSSSRAPRSRARGAHDLDRTQPHRRSSFDARGDLGTPLRRILQSARQRAPEEGRHVLLLRRRSRHGPGTSQRNE